MAPVLGAALSEDLSRSLHAAETETVQSGTSVGKERKKNSYFIQISYYINNERTLGLSGVFIFSLKQSL